MRGVQSGSSRMGRVRVELGRFESVRSLVARNAQNRRSARELSVDHVQHFFGFSGEVLDCTFKHCIRYNAPLELEPNSLFPVSNEFILRIQIVFWRNCDVPIDGSRNVKTAMVTCEDIARHTVSILDDSCLDPPGRSIALTRGPVD